MIVLDASVLIAHLDDRDAHHPRARRLVTESRDRPLATSSITLAEMLVAPARAGRLEDAGSALERLGITELALPANAAVRLAQLRTEAGLKMPDCCLILAAQEHGGMIASFDERLIKAATKLGLAVFDEI